MEPDPLRIFMSGQSMAPGMFSSIPTPASAGG